ncbi:MAG: glycosyl transferase, partial [Candidatus Glassbacteria bacterium]|nr:glycosyl transferase [Candidatus Glassbacteria bacterium]
PRPIALVIPVSLEDSRHNNFRKILKVVAGVPYLRYILVTTGQVKTHPDFVEICRKVRNLCPGASLLWSSGTRIAGLVDRMGKVGLPVDRADGKGRSVWLAYGYLIARGDCRVITTHDADIVNYDRELLGRLCFPVASHILTYEFSKGYYSRVTDRLYGRATRLFVTPLIRAFSDLIGRTGFLDYMDSFRYPLAGEFSISASLARVIQVAGDWGLEVSTLAEVYRNCAVKRICQVNICDNYEHKHQPLSRTDPRKGLSRMAEDIAKVFFRTLASQGALFPEGYLQSLVGIYRRRAYDLTEHHEADALLNDLVYDRHAEMVAVDTFAQALVRAAETFRQDPQGKPRIPSWNRVAAADPGFLEEIIRIVDEDMKEACL